MIKRISQIIICFTILTLLFSFVNFTQAEDKNYTMDKNNIYFHETTVEDNEINITNNSLYKNLNTNLLAV